MREELLQEWRGKALEGLLDNVQLILVKAGCDIQWMKDCLGLGLKILLITVAVLLVAQVR